MAISFQYNKTSLQQLDKQLKIREKTLPTIKSKESALRMEVKKTKYEVSQLAEEYENKITSFSNMYGLWNEFDNTLLTIKDVKLESKKIAGVSIPILWEIVFDVNDFLMMNNPLWFYDGMSILKEIAEISIKKEVAQRKLELLEYSRRKTTQKVNLYEKIQIPGFQEAIIKIKRYLEDEENLSKSAQKIVKQRNKKEDMNHD